MSTPTFIMIALGAVLVCAVGMLLLLWKVYRKPGLGRALIITKMTGEKRVAFTGSIVLPVMDRAEEVDLTVHSVELACSGGDGVVFEDGVRADIKMVFFVCVNNTPRDVLRVAEAVGSAQATAPESFDRLLKPRVLRALRSVCRVSEFGDVRAQSEDFQDAIMEAIGQELGGYRVEDLLVERLEAARSDALDDSAL